MPSIISAVSRPMLGNIAISVICGTIYGLSAWALGAPFPLALGLIAGFLDLIPMVGATMAGVILVLAALTQGLTAAVIMLVIVVVYQQFENYVLQPMSLGKAANVSGFLVIANVLVFAIWYWRLDAGGPFARDGRGAHTEGDFFFPQMMDGCPGPKNWSPRFVDYLFVAFNNSTAFSPTDTPVLSRWAKVLTMLQSAISLLVVGVLASRAVGLI